MPAPTPIRIRYGDDGLLGQAAATASREAVRQEMAEAQKERDFAFLMGELDRRNQMQQIVLQDELAGRRLQTAANLKRGTPLSDSVAQDRARQQHEYIMDRDQARQQSINERAELARQDKLAQQQAAGERQTKAQERQDQQLRTKLELQAVDKQIDDLMRRMEMATKAASAAGVNLSTPPAQFVPQNRDLGFFENLQDAYNPFASPSTMQAGGDPQALQMLTGYARMQNALARLQARKEAIIAGVGGTPAAAAAAASIDNDPLGVR